MSWGEIAEAQNDLSDHVTVLLRPSKSRVMTAESYPVSR